MSVTDSVERLVAEIDKLVDEELALGPCDDDVGQADCTLCGGDWHGVPADADSAAEHGRIPECPGAFASDAERAQWSAREQSLALDATVELDLADLEDTPESRARPVHCLCGSCGGRRGGRDCNSLTDSDLCSRAQRGATPPRTSGRECWPEGLW